MYDTRGHYQPAINQDVYFQHHLQMNNILLKKITIFIVRSITN